MYITPCTVGSRERKRKGRRGKKRKAQGGASHHSDIQGKDKEGGKVSGYTLYMLLEKFGNSFSFPIGLR